jgi:dipeptidyl-peptidase-4
MWGHSYGAGLTLMTMTESQEIAAGIAIAGVTDHRYHAARFTEFAMKMPANNKESYDKTSRVLSAKNLHGRLLIMHGLNDDNVRPQNTWAFVDALVDAGIDFEMMIYPMEGHGINGPKALVHRFNKMVQFWQNNL